MCGIAGLFHADAGAEASAEVVQRMAAYCAIAALTRRHLHARSSRPGGATLEIVDPAGGAQPMVNEAGDVAVVFNGEIYNFRDLRAGLRAHGYRFATDCDTEVVLRAYEHYGSRCVEHFRGMFAFAVWDGPRRELFLARDRFGIKPLYYAWDGRTFRFGSELKAILEAGASPALDATALDDFFTFNYIPAPRTIFASVRKLPPRIPCRSRGRAGRARVLGSRLRAGRGDAATCATRLGEVLRETVALHVEGVAPASFCPAGRFERAHRRGGGARRRSGRHVLDGVRGAAVRRATLRACRRRPVWDARARIAVAARCGGGARPADLALRRAVRRFLDGPDLPPLRVGAGARARVLRRRWGR
jgi:asparagine synthase (glutamine-hydrolysing)